MKAAAECGPGWEGPASPPRSGVFMAAVFLEAIGWFPSKSSDAAISLVR